MRTKNYEKPEGTKKREQGNSYLHPEVKDLPIEDVNSAEDEEEIKEDSEASTPSPQHKHDTISNLYQNLNRQTLNVESHSNRMNRRSRCITQQESATIPKKYGPPKTKNTNSENMSCFWFVCVFVIIILLCVFWFTLPTESPSKPDPEVIMEELKQSFKQPSMSFRVVSSAIENVFKENPKAPAIIVLLTSKGAENESHQFAQQLAKSVSQPNSYVWIDGSAYKSVNSDIGKKQIDNTLNNNLSTDKIQAVLVDRLDNLSGKCALMLHSFCDHENAPFKRAVFVMTVLLEEEIRKDSQPKDWDVMLQNHLTRVWSDIGEDQVTPLLSRLSGSVAAIVKSL